jgi:hypothetical protein
MYLLRMVLRAVISTIALAGNHALVGCSGVPGLKDRGGDLATI